MMQNCIKNGQPWLDTEGKRIHAHGGSVMYVDGFYYWYGENKEKTYCSKYYNAGQMLLKHNEKYWNNHYKTGK